MFAVGWKESILVLCDGGRGGEGKVELVMCEVGEGGFGNLITFHITFPCPLTAICCHGNSDSQLSRGSVAMCGSCLLATGEWSHQGWGGGCLHGVAAIGWFP